MQNIPLNALNLISVDGSLSGSLQTAIYYLCAKFADFFTKCSIFHISARLIVRFCEKHHHHLHYPGIQHTQKGIDIQGLQMPRVPNCNNLCSCKTLIDCYLDKVNECAFHHQHLDSLVIGTYVEIAWQC